MYRMMVPRAALFVAHPAALAPSPRSSLDLTPESCDRRGTVVVEEGGITTVFLAAHKPLGRSCGQSRECYTLDVTWCPTCWRRCSWRTAG